MQDVISPSPTYDRQPADDGKKKKVIFFVVILVLLALVGGAVFALRSQSSTNKKSEITPTPTVNEEPTPTEEPKIDKKDVKIQIQNGTGTPGQAGSASKALVEAGFSSDNIKTSNAKDFDHATTTVALKKSFGSVAEEVKNALKTVFDKVEIDSEELDEDNEFDIEIITGGKKFEEVTPTKASASPTATTSPSPTSTGATPTLTPTQAVTPTPTRTPTPTP